MTKWEYNVFSLPINSGVFGRGLFEPERLGTELDRLGNQGWELVSVVALNKNGDADQIVATLKRPLANA